MRGDRGTSARATSGARFAGPPQPIPSGLQRAIQDGDCVAFLGAGFTAAAKLPGWASLLTRVADTAGVPQEARRHVLDRVTRGTAHAFDEAAQILEETIGRARFLHILAAMLGQPKLTRAMDERLRWLRGIPFRAVLTTNFDGVLSGWPARASAYRSVLRPSEHRWWEPRYWNDEGAMVVKLHGDLGARSHAPHVVLTRRDYRKRLYGDMAYATFLRTVMASTTVLYLGFSFEDAYLNELRSEILALLGHERRSLPVGYAVVNDVPEASRRHYRKHEGIQLLSYDTGGGRDFSGFDRYLRAIHDATNPIVRFGRHLERKRILWVDAHPENNREAYQFLRRASARARRRHAISEVATADAALERLASAPTPFDLVITHWGEGQARDPRGRRVPTAVRLLAEIRRRGLEAPVLVFASDRHAESRKRRALGLGAHDYCFRFQALFRRIEAIFAPAAETG